MKQPLRFAVIGTGWIAQDFMTAINATKGAQLLAICSRSPEKAREIAEKFSAPLTFTSVEELCACPQVDAVYIASPNALHAVQAKACLMAGKHVICEKPIAVTPEEVASLQALADEHHCVYMEALMGIHLPQFKTLQQWLPRLGRISSVHFDFTQYSSKFDAYRKGQLPNIFNPKFCTGALMDLGVYCVSLAVALFGMPKEVGSCASFLESGADGTGCAFLKYDGFQVILSYSKVSSTKIISEIQGDEGAIRFPSVSKLLELTCALYNQPEEVLTSPNGAVECMGPELQDFLALVADESLRKDAFHRQVSYGASVVMKEIREKAGIAFPDYTPIA